MLLCGLLLCFDFTVRQFQLGNCFVQGPSTTTPTRYYCLDMVDVAAVTLKLPSFWQGQPEAWFALAEAQFSLRNISADDTRYYYIVSALDAETATRALSIISAPPSTNKYDTIKAHLLSAYGLSNAERATALFNLKGLGDSKPSELMDSMLSLLGSHTPCFLFKHLFCQQLPEYVRTPLASSEITDLRKFALEADKYFNAGSPTNPTVSIIDRTDQPLSPPNTSLCWYHQRFGGKARRCIKPCQFRPAPGNAKQGQ